MSTWPVTLSTDGRVSAGALLWRHQGRLQLTIVVKAGFSIVPDGVAAYAEPGAIVTVDRQLDNLPTKSLAAASDLAPYLPRCDVVLTGHAYPPGGQPAPSGSARLGIARDSRLLLDKVVHVFGERKHGHPEPFAKMPLTFERAFGGPGEPNPVGSESPNVVDPADPRRPAAFAPISRFWPLRKRLLGALDRKAIEAPIAEVPDAMPWEYYQAAPPEQRIEYLRGGEWLVLDGLHPSRPRVQTCLPPARGAACVVVAGAAPAPVALVCDTLAIDADRQAFSLVWRGRHEVIGGEAALSRLLVVAALEAPGTSVDWSRLVASAPKAVAPAATVSAPPPGDAGEGTMAVSPEQAAALSSRAATPFLAISEAPGQSARAPSTAATPWGQSALRPAETASVGEGTIAAEVGEGTMAVRPEQQAALSQRAVAPFAIAAPNTESANPAVALSATPWSGVAAPAPRAAAGEETLALREGPVSAPRPEPPAMLAPPAAAAAPVSVQAPASARAEPSPAAAPKRISPPKRPVRAPTPVTAPPQKKAPPPRPADPDALAGKLRAAGAGEDDMAALALALRPPPPPPPEDE